MPVVTVPHQLVKLGFTGARLPLTVAERVAARTGFDVSALPPVTLYDTVEAQAKMIVGRLLGDEELSDEGLRQETALRRRAGAEWLADEAAAVRHDAGSAMEDTVERAEETRRRAHAEADARKEQIRAEEEEAKREARAKAAKRQQAVRQAARTRQKAVAARERQAELARIKAESEALDKASEAVEAERVVTAIDEHLDARHAARRND